jgi:hypothetical protein
LKNSKKEYDGNIPKILAGFWMKIESRFKCYRPLISLIFCIGILLALNSRPLHAQTIKLVRYFDTSREGIIDVADPAGIAYHPPSGRLFFSDSERNEFPGFSGSNVFEVSTSGDQVLREIATGNTEPAGITYSEFDQYFYIVNDDIQTISRYDNNFNNALVEVLTTDDVPTAQDPEGITADPATGLLYVADGNDDGGGCQVLVYNSDLQFQYSFPATVPPDAEGIAFNPANNHLFIINGGNLKLYEYTLAGFFVTEYALGGFSPRPIDTQGLTFAPTSDPNDDPKDLAIYIADGMLDQPETAVQDGRIYEAIIILGPHQVVPKDFKLRNYPNPFNVSTTIVYDLLTAIHVHIVVTDILGREVAVLVNGYQSRGRHEIGFRGENLSAGMYVISMQAGTFRQVQRLVLAR